MASEIEICNRALSRISVNYLIEDLTELSVQAQNCNQHYAPCRDEALEDAPWNFAQKVEALAVVADVTIPGYQFAYRYPTDCLKASVLTDEMGQRMPLQVCAWDVWNYDLFEMYRRRAPFRVMADPSTDGARIICTDMPEAYLWYTVRVIDPNQMSTLFRSALAWKLAGELALIQRADPRLAQTAMQQYMAEVSRAQASTLNEAQPDAPPPSPSIQARL